MSTPSEQLVVSALRRAADEVVLPPESRWIRERGSTAHMWTVAVVLAATVFIVAVGGAITALRAEPRVVPAAQRDAFSAAEDAAWARVRAEVPPDVVVNVT